MGVGAFSRLPSGRSGAFRHFVDHHDCDRRRGVFRSRRAGVAGTLDRRAVGYRTRLGEAAGVHRRGRRHARARPQPVVARCSKTSSASRSRRSGSSKSANRSRWKECRRPLRSGDCVGSSRRSTRRSICSSGRLRMRAATAAAGDWRSTDGTRAIGSPCSRGCGASARWRRSRRSRRLRSSIRPIPFPSSTPATPATFEASALSHPLMAEADGGAERRRARRSAPARAHRQRLEHVWQKHAAPRDRHERGACAGRRNGTGDATTDVAACDRRDDPRRRLAAGGATRGFTPRSSASATSFSARRPVRRCSSSTKSCTEPTRTIVALAPRRSSSRSSNAARSVS